MRECKVFVGLNHAVFVNEAEIRAENFCRVWQKVIYQAFIDAGNTSKKPRVKIQKLRAINWLRGEEDSFCEVCLLAGLDPDYVKNQAAKVLQNTPKWIGDTEELCKILSGDMD